MKIVVIGGTGLIGTKLVARLRQKGHEVVAASPASGVNTITGEGLAEALAGAQVVVDVANSPSFEDEAVLKFFETSGRNLLAAEPPPASDITLRCRSSAATGFPTAATCAPRWRRSSLIKASGIPYTIVRSTQFFEFVNGIAQSGTDGQTVRLSPALLQPIMSDDVADAWPTSRSARRSTARSRSPARKRFRSTSSSGGSSRAKQDPRTVIADTHARYFGAELDDRSLTPLGKARIGATRFDDWLSHSSAQR